jgi:hypothetical protein
MPTNDTARDLPCVLSAKRLAGSTKARPARFRGILIPEAHDGGKAMSKSKKSKNPHIGSSFDDFLKEEGIYQDVQTTAIKRVLASQLEAAMKTRKLTKVEMARRMRTSRVQLDRLLDPDNDSVTLATLRRAAAVVGREVRLELV